MSSRNIAPDLASIVGGGSQSARKYLCSILGSAHLSTSRVNRVDSLPLSFLGQASQTTCYQAQGNQRVTSGADKIRPGTDEIPFYNPAVVFARQSLPAVLQATSPIAEHCRGLAIIAVAGMAQGLEHGSETACSEEPLAYSRTHICRTTQVG